MLSMAQQMALMDRAIAKETKNAAALRALKADHKIQIVFRSNRSIHKPIEFNLTFWQSGHRLNGGGDEMMFVCKRIPEAPDVQNTDIDWDGEYKVKPKKRGCGKLIEGEWSAGWTLCPHCGTKHLSEWVVDSIYYKVDVNKAAQILASWMTKLRGDADIYAKYNPKDPRYLAMASAQGARKARELKGLTVYEKKAILSDLSTGATLVGRMKAFITA